MPLLKKEDYLTSQGIRKTSSLFIETSRTGDKPIFTLSSHRDDYIRLQDLYVQYCVDDATELTFAEEVFGDYVYWEFLSKANSQIREAVAKWRQLAEVHRKRKAFKSIVKEVEDDGKNAFAASRYLIQEPWKDKTTPKKRAASKETSEVAANSYKSDFERLKSQGHLQ